MDWTHLKNLEWNDLSLSGDERSILGQLAERLQDNYPYHSPLYAGQMIKPPHAIAQAAYWMATFVNPNNHALDGGRATSALELECVAELAAMVQFDQHLGHLTSGGTVANLEALWVARGLQPGRTVLANENAHYTHSRMSEVLAMPYQSVPATPDGTMDLNALERALEQHPGALVVATLGTTGAGAVDPLHEILPMARRYGARVHVDAAYGGYFKLVEEELPERARRAFEATTLADSLVIDPHKHGLQPYGCGAVLFRDPSVGRLYKHDSPYTYFTSDALHLGEITLECSRPGAQSAALWATLQAFPLRAGGTMAQRLRSSLAAARGFAAHAEARGWWTLPPTLDIVVYSRPGESASEMSQRNKAHFTAAAHRGVHLALFQLKRSQCPWPVVFDQEEVTVLRSVLMKPEHNDPLVWEAILAEN